MESESKLGDLLDGTPELRQFLEEQRRAAHATATAYDKLLGYSNKVTCPNCGIIFDPKKAKAK